MCNELLTIKCLIIPPYFAQFKAVSIMLPSPVILHTTTHEVDRTEREQYDQSLRIRIMMSPYLVQHHNYYTRLVMSIGTVGK